MMEVVKLMELHTPQQVLTHKMEEGKKLGPRNLQQADKMKSVPPMEDRSFPGEEVVATV